MLNPHLQEFSERQLKFVYWYVTHRLLLRRILIIFLVVLSLFFWGYGIFGLINYYFLEQPKFNRMLREMSLSTINYEFFRVKNQPKSFAILSTTALPNGKEKYDLVAKVLNPNDKWRAEFDYKFILDGEETEAKRGFILPGEEKFLVGLAVERKRKPQRIELEILNISWQRLDSHLIPDYNAWNREHLNFEITNVQFLPAVVRDTLPISKVSFHVKNKTAYSYWNVGFYILLYRGNSITGVTYVTLNQFVSGEERNVEVSWFEVLPNVTKVEVRPEVNIFDSQVFMPVK